MPSEIRLDASGKLGKIERTPQGGARIPASLTRAGVFSYKQPDGSMRREWRPSKEVFREDALRALDSLPVIIGHSAWVTPSNYSSVTKGIVDAGSAKRRGSFVDGRVTVQAADALTRCDSTGADSLTDLSLGYSMQYTPGAGVVPDGEPDAGQRYDGIQSNLVANHVALLPPGTSRAAVGFRFDALDDPLAGAPVLVSEPFTPQAAPQQEKKMPKLIRLDSKEHDVETPEGALSLQQAVEKIRQDKLDAETRANKAEGERDGFKTKVGTLETQLSDTTRLDSLVEKRVELESSARTILGADFVCKGKTNREIQIAVIRHDAKDFTGLGPDGKSATGEAKPDVYVEARFDSVVEHSIPSGSIHQVRNVLNNARPPEVRIDRKDGPIMSASERARLKLNEDSQNAWRGGRN